MSVARHWGNTSDEEKAVWRVRADQMKEQYAETHPQMSTEMDEASLQPEHVPLANTTATASAGMSTSDGGDGAKKKMITKKSGTTKNVEAMPV